MEMVATSKRKRLQHMLGDADRYLSELRRLFGTMTTELGGTRHPLLETREKVKFILLVVITSDTGLCGSYNNAVLEVAQDFLKGKDPDQTFSTIAIGRHAAQYFKKAGQNLLETFSVPRPQQIDELTSHLSALVCDQYSNRKADRVVFAYTKTLSFGALKPMTETFLPVLTQTKGTPESGKIGYLLEPSSDEILEVLVPAFVSAQVGYTLKNAFLAEQISRMIAMHQATENADEVIENLTLARNKARQAAITKELIEVVSGSRALQRE